MKWIKFVELHHNIIKISDNIIRINYIAKDEAGNYYDNEITKVNDYYMVTELSHASNQVIRTYIEYSIKSYLGY